MLYAYAANESTLRKQKMIFQVFYLWVPLQAVVSSRNASSPTELLHCVTAQNRGLDKGRTIKGDLDGAIFAYNSGMRLAHVMSATRIVSPKSGERHLHDSCTPHEKCHRILKHVLKPYHSRSHNQNVGMTSCIRSLPDASSARYKSRQS